MIDRGTLRTGALAGALLLATCTAAAFAGSKPVAPWDRSATPSPA